MEFLFLWGAFINLGTLFYTTLKLIFFIGLAPGVKVIITWQIEAKNWIFDWIILDFLEWPSKPQLKLHPGLAGECCRQHWKRHLLHLLLYQLVVGQERLHLPSVCWYESKNRDRVKICFDAVYSRFLNEVALRKC